jgi:hypothetical protein
MPQSLSKNQRIVAFAVSFVLAFGFSLVLYNSLIGKIKETEPGERFFVDAFCAMMIAMGISGFLRIFAGDNAAILNLSALLFSFSFAIFGALFIAVGIFGSHRIKGGIPYFSSNTNQIIGAILFIVAGSAVLLFLPKIYRHKRDDG